MIVGIVLAVLLLLLAYVLFPPDKRRRVRQGAVLLALSVVCGVAHEVLPSTASVDQALLFLGEFFLLGSIGRSLVLVILDVAVERRSLKPTPRIFRDLSTAIIYLVVALLALRTVGVEPGSILTTSALLTAVVGLSMQDTLGNLVAGLALQMQRPFDVGDWIEIDNGAQAGRVSEITWRATSIMTLDNVEVILPNAGLAKSPIRNYSRPSPLSRRRVVVNVAYAAAPTDVHEVLVAAAMGVPGVLPEPSPLARTQAFGDSAIQYEVLYVIDDFVQANNIDACVRDRIYFGLARHDMDMPFPTRTLLMLQGAVGDNSGKTEHARRVALIEAVPLLAPLPQDARQILAERAALRRFGPGEVVVRKGDPSMEMYIVERGALAVEIPRVAGSPAEVARLGKGECFGEMGLLAGEPRAATVRAKTLCDLLVIDHGAFHEVLASHPEVVDRMGELLAMRQAGLEAATAEQAQMQPTLERSRRLISQIKIFFRLV